MSRFLNHLIDRSTGTAHTVNPRIEPGYASRRSQTRTPEELISKNRQQDKSPSPRRLTPEPTPDDSFDAGDPSKPEPEDAQPAESSARTDHSNTPSSEERSSSKNAPAESTSDAPDDEKKHRSDESQPPSDTDTPFSSSGEPGRSTDHPPESERVNDSVSAEPDGRTNSESNTPFSSEDARTRDDSISEKPDEPPENQKTEDRPPTPDSTTPASRPFEEDPGRNQIDSASQHNADTDSEQSSADANRMANRDGRQEPENDREKKSTPSRPETSPSRSEQSSDANNITNNVTDAEEKDPPTPSKKRADRTDRPFRTSNRETLSPEPERTEPTGSPEIREQDRPTRDGGDPPQINVQIDRVELSSPSDGTSSVRQEQADAQEPTNHEPDMSLDDYLSAREGEGGTP